MSSIGLPVPARPGVALPDEQGGPDLNSPKWEEYQVMGDSILWKDVFPNVDLSVRYVHDTLKVDVLLREPLVERLRSQVGSGSLEAEGFLTARFEIPQAVVTSEVRQGGEPRDLYGPPVAVDIDGATSQTIIGVEIGNEEDAYFLATVDGATHTWVKWPSDAQNDYGYPDRVDWATSTICYEGGKDFAEYYKAAKDRIDDRWPNLYVISGGSVVDYDTLSEGDDQFTTGVGQFAGAFIAGFIDGTTEESGGSLGKLPDYIGIHGYTDPYPAEGIHSTEDNVNRREWLEQLDYLSDRCSRGGYSPDFAVTESGFLYSATQAESQPVYYLRRCLMDATNRAGSSGPPYLHSFYFHHPKSPLWAGGLGAMHDTSGNSRAIRKAARILQATATAQNPYPELGHQGTEIWIPAKTDRTGGDEGENIMTCGWETESGQKWGAIWRYANRNDGYWTVEEDNKDFVVEGEDLRPLKAYRYQFSGLSSYSTVSFQLLSGTGIDGDYSGGNTTYSIPGVTQNPTFLRFAE